MNNPVGLGVVGAVVGAAIGYFTKPQPSLGMLATVDPDATYQSAIVTHIAIFAVVGLAVGAALGALTLLTARGK
ncbi:conserved hypothetical protein [Mesorhizobium plurifarium]|uniref:Uncharacterized protein n=1 Tax=Mesorhizobium plurifarium TaxID=69974 RepID=A0A090E2P7_MESPL|nr:conserved hypothetical protein [Mesorhizobium plurifarium]